LNTVTPTYDGVDLLNRESPQDYLEEVDKDELDTLEAVINGRFRDVSKTHFVNDNIKNTAFATLVRPDGHIQVVSKQLGWFLEEAVWKNCRDRKWRFKGCPPVFLHKENN